MTEHKFFDSSPEAKAPYVRKVGHPKYPWKIVPVGKSFPVSKSDIKFSTLRSLASKTGSELGKRFRVIDHEGDFYEVACLPMEQEQAIATSSNLIEAMDKMGNSDETQT